MRICPRGQDRRAISAVRKILAERLLRCALSQAARGALTALAICAAMIASSPEVDGVELADLFDVRDTSWVRQAGESEENESEIETDRDSLTPATTTAAAGRTIFESSYSMIDNRSAARAHSYPEILTRIGLTDRIELRLGWNYEAGGGNSISNGDPGGELETGQSSHESQLLYGLKFGMTKQQSWIPQSACVLQATTPTSGVENYTDLQVGYVFGWKLQDDWQLDSAIRYFVTKEEGDHFNQWVPSVVLKRTFAEKWAGHVEYFGNFTNARAHNLNQQYLSPGLHYLITPDVEIGVRVGWGLNQDAANFFSNVGLGVQF